MGNVALIINPRYSSVRYQSYMWKHWLECLSRRWWEMQFSALTPLVLCCCYILLLFICCFILIFCFLLINVCRFFSGYFWQAGGDGRAPLGGGGPPRARWWRPPRAPRKNRGTKLKIGQIRQMLLKVSKMPFKVTKRVAKRYKKRS